MTRAPDAHGPSSPVPTSSVLGQRYSSRVSDAAYKELFSHPRMVEDLLRGIVAPEWSGALDFTTLEKLPRGVRER